MIQHQRYRPCDRVVIPVGERHSLQNVTISACVEAVNTFSPGVVMSIPLRIARVGPGDEFVQSAFSTSPRSLCGTWSISTYSVLSTKAPVTTDVGVEAQSVSRPGARWSVNVVI